MDSFKGKASHKLSDGYIPFGRSPWDIPFFVIFLLVWAKVVFIPLLDILMIYQNN
jgi:hypothetical protein